MRLEELLTDDDAVVRNDAAEDLEPIASVKSIEPLLRALQDYDIFVRTAALRTLSKLGTPAASRLIGDIDSMTKAYALAALMEYLDDSQLPAELKGRIVADTKLVRCARWFSL